MSGLIIDVEPKEHSVEGHTKLATLYFKGKPIWGPDKEKTVEGHIATITIKTGDKVYLDQLSTHDNMKGLRDAVRKVLAEEGN
ncbi:hypothetical protein VTH06DRAFT_4181 [Thermothelomyces fergusii]